MMYRCIKPAYIDGKVYSLGDITKTVPKGWEKYFKALKKK